MVKALFVALLAVGLAAPASAGVLDIGQVSEFVYEQIKKRGIAVTLMSIDGKKSAGGALKVCILHNKSKTENYLALTLGIEAVFSKEAKTYGRLHAGIPANLTDLMRRAGRWSWVEKYLNVMRLPDDWELWGGPFVRAPASKDDKWQWKSHTGAFFSLGKKFGGGSEE